MAARKRQLDWTAIKNALRLGGLEIRKFEIGIRLHPDPSRRHYLCNKDYAKNYGSLDNWSVKLTRSETQDTELLIGLILSYSRGKK